MKQDKKLRETFVISDRIQTVSRMIDYTIDECRDLNSPWLLNLLSESKKELDFIRLEQLKQTLKN